jgi:hypothetical protein
LFSLFGVLGWVICTVFCVSFLCLCVSFIIGTCAVTPALNKLNLPELLLMHVCLIHRVHWLDQE